MYFHSVCQHIRRTGFRPDWTAFCCVCAGVIHALVSWVGIFVYLVAIVHGWSDLSEDISGLCLWQPPPLVDVVVQLSSTGVLHHYHYLIATLKHCRERTDSSCGVTCVACHSSEGVWVFVVYWMCVSARACLRVQLTVHRGVECVCALTFVDSNDVGVFQGGGDFDLSLDVHFVQVVSDSFLPDGFNGHLGKHRACMSIQWDGCEKGPSATPWLLQRQGGVQLYRTE